MIVALFTLGTLALAELADDTYQAVDGPDGLPDAVMVNWPVPGDGT